jgi:hypothetical protein
MIEGTEKDALRAIRSATTTIEKLLENKDAQPEIGAYVSGVLQSTLDSLSYCFTDELADPTRYLLTLLDQVW